MNDIIGDCSCKSQLEEILNIWTQYYHSTIRVLANFMILTHQQAQICRCFSGLRVVQQISSAVLRECHRIRSPRNTRRIDLPLSLFTIVSIYGDITVCIDLHIGRVLHHQFRHVVGSFDYLLHLLEASIDQRHAGPF